MCAVRSARPASQHTPRAPQSSASRVGGWEANGASSNPRDQRVAATLGAKPSAGEVDSEVQERRRIAKMEVEVGAQRAPAYATPRPLRLCARVLRAAASHLACSLARRLARSCAT